MADQPVAFAGSIPEFYESHPRFAFFESYAEDLAARAAGAAGEFLELACGMGILTRKLLARLGPGARLTASDLHPPMIEEARRVRCPGARYRFSVWGSLAENPANPAVLDARSALLPDDPPRFLEAPFFFHDGDLIRDLLKAGGFSGIQIEPVSRDCRSPSARAFATGLVRGTPLANDLAARNADFEAAMEAVSGALARMGGAKPFSAPMKALVVEAAAG
jgi:hypothetical protein